MCHFNPTSLWFLIDVIILQSSGLIFSDQNESWKSYCSEASETTTLYAKAKSYGFCTTKLTRVLVVCNLSLKYIWFSNISSIFSFWRKNTFEAVKAVLRIQLILMRIRILDPHWKKIDPDPNPYPDPDPGYFFEIYWIFLTKQNLYIFCLIFFAYFFAKTWWTIQKSGNYNNLSFFNSSDLGFESYFFAVFGWYFPPWIRIRGSAYFCGSGSGS